MEKDKQKFYWTAMIRQPEFVTMEIFERAKEELRKKKPGTDPEKARLVLFEEGLCCQVMHIGSYDSEPETIGKMQQYLEKNDYITDLSEQRKHHEIYLGDPRRTAPEKLRTVIRHPIRKGTN